MAGRTAVQRKADEDARLEVRAPAQTRARETLERIIAAAQRLLRKQRFEEITIAEIVAEADTSTGSFYARFGSKEALLPYLYAAYNADVAATTEEFAKRGGLQARTLRGAAAALVDILYDGPVRMDGLVRTMVLYGRSHPERLPESAFKRTNLFYDMVVALFKPHMKARDADQRARMAAYAIATLLREYRFFPDAPLSKALGIEHKDFVVEVERMAAAYLEAAR